MNTRQKFLLWSILPAILLFAIPLRAYSETYEQFVERACSNGPRIISLHKRATEAQAMLEDSRSSQLSREEAREKYHCSQNASDPYLHDVALLLYADELLASLRTNGDFDNYATVIASTLNDLAAATRFPDVRERALKGKDVARASQKDAHNAIYGVEATQPPSQAYAPLSAYLGSWTGVITDGVAGSGTIRFSLAADPGGSIHGYWNASFANSNFDNYGSVTNVQQYGDGSLFFILQSDNQGAPILLLRK